MKLQIAVTVRGGIVCDVYCSDPSAEVEIIDLDEGDEDAEADAEAAAHAARETLHMVY
jgi:hypothetical protein